MENTLAILRSVVCEWYVVFDCCAIESKRHISGSVNGDVAGDG
jgi:hypothetical protein